MAPIEAASNLKNTCIKEGNSLRLRNYFEMNKSDNKGEYKAPNLTWPSYPMRSWVVRKEKKKTSIFYQEMASKWLALIGGHLKKFRAQANLGGGGETKTIHRQLRRIFYH